MSRRNLIRKFPVMSAIDPNTDPWSVPTDVSGVDFITYQLLIDNTIDSTLNVYFCNDDVFTTANTTALNFGSATPLDGAVTDEYVVHIENKGFKWMAIHISNNAGTGLISAWVTGAGRGA